MVTCSLSEMHPVLGLKVFVKMGEKKPITLPQGLTLFPNEDQSLPNYQTRLGK